MKSFSRVGRILVLVSVAMVGCQPSTESSNSAVEYYPPGPEFKLSRKAAAKEQATAAQAEPPPEPELPAEKPSRKTVFESLYQAVRNGAAEAMGEATPAP